MQTTSDLHALSLDNLVWLASAQPLLDDRTESELVARRGAGDRRATEKLVLSNVRVVLDEAIRARGLGRSQEILVRAGVRALVEAVRCYDAAEHGAFSDHLRDRVRAALRQAFEVS